MITEQDIQRVQDSQTETGETVSKFMGDLMIRTWKENGQKTYCSLRYITNKGYDLREVEVVSLDDGWANIIVKAMWLDGKLSNPYPNGLDVKQEEILVEMKGVER